MKIQTMSIVVGDNRCNANCPFCISKITGKLCNSIDSYHLNWRNFDIACKLAEKAGATTVLLTGKGEPTLHPYLILQYVQQLKNFPFIELQTNGIKLNDPDYTSEEFGGEKWLKLWYQAGLTTICLSTVHYSRERNREIYGESYPDIGELVHKLHAIGYTIRLSVMLLKGFIDNPSEVLNLVNFCKHLKISQLTIRPIDSPISNNSPQAEFVLKHTLGDNEWRDIKSYIKDIGTPILELAHGGKVYDFMGQNICLATCLTTNKSIEDMRQIIFMPNGEIRYDWKHNASILLKGRD